MIVAEKLTKEYSLGTTLFLALHDVSFQIENEKFIAFVGESGSGKSTLFHILGGLDRATSGNISVDGVNIIKLDKKSIAQYRNKKIGFVFQSFHLETSYSVYKNVELPLIISGLPERDRRELVEHALGMVGLLDKLKNRVTELSGGERQRTSIARAIVNSPDYILADEPCGNLDSENSDIIMALLRSLSDIGKTVLLVTHNRDDAQKADRVIELKDGRIVSDAHK